MLTKVVEVFARHLSIGTISAMISRAATKAINRRKLSSGVMYKNREEGKASSNRSLTVFEFAEAHFSHFEFSWYCKVFECWNFSLDKLFMATYFRIAIFFFSFFSRRF